MQRWFAAMTREYREAVALADLKQRGFNAMLLHQQVRFTVRGAVRETKELLFPEYVFVMLDLERDPWRWVNSARGVIQLLPLGCEVPVPIEVGRMEGLLADVVAGKHDVDASPRLYKRGEMVEVLQAPWLESGEVLTGVCQRTRSGHVTIMPCTGKRYAVEVPLRHTRPAAVMARAA